MSTQGKKRLSGAMAFITLMGIVSLFSDMTHEGARSILGEYLNLAGASAATVGFVSGMGDLYDIDPVWLAAVSVAVQALAIVFYILCIRQQKKEAEA